MKGQNLLIQFILFFLIGFTFFISVAYFFKYQSDIFKDQVSDYNLNLVNSYMSANALTELVSCKQCDYVDISVKIQAPTTGNVFEIGMDSRGVNTSIPLTQKKITTSIYNLNSSYTLSGFAASVEPISITFTRAQNNLRVS